MHNVNVDYTSSLGLNVGLDYTYYNYPSTQDYINKTESSEQLFLADASPDQSTVGMYMPDRPILYLLIGS